MNRDEIIAGIVGAAMLFAFAYVDFTKSLGVSAPILYTALVVVGLLAHSRLLVVVFATLAAALTIIGSNTFAGGSDEMTEVINRALAVFAIAVTAVGSYLMLKRQSEYDVYLRHLADKDGLTGVANRRALMDEAGMRLREAQRYHLPLAVLLIDIDHFKAINDRHGHLTGDQVLREVSQACTAQLRQSDLLGRYGGEEFVVICPNTPCKSAELLAERLRATVSSLKVMGKSQEFGISISVGVASFGASGVTTVEELLQAADEALYRAKASGRNRVVVNDGPQMVFLNQSRVA